MYLKDFIPNLRKEYLNYSFTNIAFNSSQIKKNYIFFAIKGSKFDGHNFIEDAIKRGSKIIIYEKKFTGFKDGVLFICSKNIRKLLAEFSFKLNNNIPKNLIAVTGTNGKSSVADFYFQILKLNNKKVASIGTLGIKTDNSFHKLSNTTIDALDLSKKLSNLKKQKINNIIMEASSHGLDQNRLDGLKFNIGIFTNLSHDHLDYHNTMKDYLNAKLYLFKNLMNKKKFVITDESIPQYKLIKKVSKHKNLSLIDFSEKNKKSKIFLQSINYDGDKQILQLKINSKIYVVEINLIGKVQIKNLILAIIAAAQSGLSYDKIFKILPYIKSINGRLERVGVMKNNSKVILDYAHTPDALRTVLTNIKDQFPQRNVVLLFGCGGDRDKLKRQLMGKIASQFADKIYLTDDNPRNENPNLIRSQIKKGIKSEHIFELSDRGKAIDKAIKNLQSGEILLVAGKGHEETQTYKNKINFFSDKKEILKSIKQKNKLLSNDLKLNIIQEKSKTKISDKKIKLNKITINSKEVKKNDIFFAIKGKKNDGHKFLADALNKKASLVVVNKTQRNIKSSRQIKVKDTLNFLTDISQEYRKNLKTKLITITGSSGKTSLKDLLGSTLKKFYKTSFSKKSFNNKFGVPLSLININQGDKFGVLEAGMDKKGEIDFLTKIIQPDVGVITNISYAHIKNFKNINGIASAKGEIINNIKKNGHIVLNRDDKFFNFHEKLAKKRKLNIHSFSLKNKKANVFLKRILKSNNRYKLLIDINNQEKTFFVKNNFTNLISNILNALSIMNILIDVTKLNQNIFLNIKNTEGRGDVTKIKLNNKKINLIDESYNSNPLSLKSSLMNFNSMKVNPSKKNIILGDMLELGKHSKRLHKDMSKVINKISFNKLHVMGKHILETYKRLPESKRGKIIKNDSELTKLMFFDFKNNDFLMVKGSNSTGLFNYLSKLKKKNNHAL
ncbi:UDP-N-acetylmuramoyl-L-alanyl-D-glutamate--2,6-diaminopimelate ligase [Candidatus Pelagibacter sp.]|uniref:UDP-N-acetylmuramoyl-L-alanyl-D-glutamate--2, 6-diaminopimelate ligase n=1 Tax=Candidatus Pelagibacter sp. TaxID=2024849 RepID=UPI003F8357D7